MTTTCSTRSGSSLTPTGLSTLSTASCQTSWTCWSRHCRSTNPTNTRSSPWTSPSAGATSATAWTCWTLSPRTSSPGRGTRWRRRPSWARWQHRLTGPATTRSPAHCGDRGRSTAPGWSRLCGGGTSGPPARRGARPACSPWQTPCCCWRGATPLHITPVSRTPHTYSDPVRGRGRWAGQVGGTSWHQSRGHNNNCGQQASTRHNSNDVSQPPTHQHPDYFWYKGCRLCQKLYEGSKNGAKFLHYGSLGSI